MTRTFGGGHVRDVHFLVTLQTVIWSSCLQKGTRVRSRTLQARWPPRTGAEAAPLWSRVAELSTKVPGDSRTHQGSGNSVLTATPGLAPSA